MAQPTDPAEARAALDVIAGRLEPLVHHGVRGVGPLAWAEQMHDGELAGIAAFVRPDRAHSGGVTVTLHSGADLGIAIGPAEVTFAVREGGLERAVAVLAAALKGGALVEVFHRWWRVTTRITVPAYGAGQFASTFNHEFPGYPVGKHYVAPALVTDVGRSGAALTHSAAEVAIGTATAGAQIGGKVSITDTGAFWFQWEGPGEHQYNDAVYEERDLAEVLADYDNEIAWDWMEPEFAAWIASRR